MGSDPAQVQCPCFCSCLCGLLKATVAGKGLGRDFDALQIQLPNMSQQAMGCSSEQAWLGLVGSNREELGSAGCWCGAGACPGCAPHCPSTARHRHRDRGCGRLGAEMALAHGLNDLGEGRATGCGGDSSPPPQPSMLSPCSALGHPAAVHPPKGTKGSSVRARR